MKTFSTLSSQFSKLTHKQSQFCSNSNQKKSMRNTVWLISSSIRLHAWATFHIKLRMERLDYYGRTRRTGKKWLRDSYKQSALLMCWIQMMRRYFWLKWKQRYSRMRSKWSVSMRNLKNWKVIRLKSKCIADFKSLMICWLLIKITQAYLLIHKTMWIKLGCLLNTDMSRSLMSWNKYLNWATTSKKKVWE